MLHSTQKLRRQRSTYNNIVSLAYDQCFFVYFVLFLSGVGRHLTPQHLFFCFFYLSQQRLKQKLFSVLITRILRHDVILIYLYSVCAALLICLNARDYTKVIILEALIRDGKVSKLGNFILEGAHWINPSVGQSRVVQSMA